MTIGGGSSSLKVKYEVSPLEGIVERARRAGIEVVYKTGYASPAVAAQDVKGAVAPEKIFDLATLRAEAVEAAREADMVLFVGGLNKNSGQDCEGDDRESMALPYEQDALVEALAKANPNIAVVNMYSVFKRYMGFFFVLLIAIFFRTVKAISIGALGVILFFFI